MVLPDAAGNFLSAPSWPVARGCFVTPAGKLPALCLMTALTDCCTEAVKTFSAVSALLLPGAYPESSPALASSPSLSAAPATCPWAAQDPWAQRSRGGLPATTPRPLHPHIFKLTCNVLKVPGCPGHCSSGNPSLQQHHGLPCWPRRLCCSLG